MEDSTFINQSSDENGIMKPKKGKVLTQTSLYAEDCLTLLQQALDHAGSSPEEAGGTKRQAKSRYASSSDEDEQDGGSDSGEQSDDSSEENKATEQPQDAAQQQPQPNQGSAATAVKLPPKTQVKLEKFIKRQSDVRVRKYVDTLTCHNFQLVEPANAALCLPTSVLSKDERLAEHPSMALRAFEQLSKDLQTDKPVVVLFVRSGRFAGAVFERGECISHHTKTTYTIRKGQGKAQSTQDAQRRAKSIGSQLRRQGEEKLQEDITECATRWKPYMDSAALLLVSCPKTMKKYFFASLEGILSREDDRIRRVPLDLGRPTFENAVLIHDVLTTVTVREMVEEASDKQENPIAQTETATTATSTVDSTKKQSSDAAWKSAAQAVEIPLSALHVACKNGDLEVIRDILTSNSNELTVMAGPDLMTPLHYAAVSSKAVEPSVAAECVKELLVEGRADPSLLDGRTRPPYFLASHEAVRDAFRIARASLGESFCDWECAKVGPPLTAADLQKRKEKEAEKRKKKKARQKQKKAQEKVAAEEMEQRRQEEENKAREAEEAKRVRDGLQPKTSRASNVCDFCQKECKGRKRSQMFKRLEYAYCSTSCVQDHKRELMAKAALSRFGS